MLKLKCIIWQRLHNYLITSLVLDNGAISESEFGVKIGKTLKRCILSLHYIRILQILKTKSFHYSENVLTCSYLLLPKKFQLYVRHLYLSGAEAVQSV